MNEKNRALIFGGNIGSTCLIRTLQSEGFHCTVLGHDPKQIGAYIADDYYDINYHDQLSIPSIIREREFKVIIPGSHDIFFKAYAAFLDALKQDDIPEFEESLSWSFEQLHGKQNFRRNLQLVSRVHCPEFIEFDEKEINEISPKLFPALFKPNHAGGGRGIVRFETPESFSLRDEALTLGAGVLEKVVEGIDLSISVWMNEGNVTNWYADREFSEVKPFHISGSLSNNLLIKLLEQWQVISELGELLQALRQHTGFYHCQVRLQSKETWFLIEVTKRLPGDLYPVVPEWFANFDYTKGYVDSFRGKSPKGNQAIRFRREQPVGRVCMYENYALRSEFIPVSCFSSHGSPTPDSYRVCFILSERTLDLFSENLSLIEV